MELYYNPERMTETEVKETFVANQWLVDEILSILKQQSKGAGVQHALIIAPRGMGKTTVLLMLRFSILESELAQRWQPVLFPEESYAIYDLADFWLSGLGHLAADTNDKELDDKISELQRTYKDGDELEEAALATIKDWSSANQKQLLMLVDSFDVILDQIGDEREYAKLRDVLMNDGTMMLVGGGTTFFKQARDYEQPLYNLFKRYDLQTLSSDQIHDLLRRRAKLDGAENFEEVLRRNAARIRVLEYFTGGNPRLVMMLYRVITRSEVSEVRRGLEKLLDEVTPYYKAKIESLPAQQRKILDHIARISSRTREGLTPTEIATSTRLPTNQISSQLKRLADLGYVRAANIRGRSSYYTLSEPLYAIWHQMRFGREARDRMNWLVSFLKGWYDTEELSSECVRLHAAFNEYLATGRLSEARDALEYRSYLIAALDHNLASLALNGQRPLTDSQLAESHQRINRGQLALMEQRYAEAVNHFMGAIELNPNSVPAHFGLVLAAIATGNVDVALLRLEETGQSVPRDSLIANASSALRGALKNDFNEVASNLSRLSPSSEVALIWFQVGVVFYSSNLVASLKCFSRVTDLDPKRFLGWYWRARTLYGLNKREETVASLDEALQLEPDSYSALHLRGLTLSKLGKNAKALSSFDRALEINPRADETWCSRSLALLALNRKEEALTSIEKACELNPDADDVLLERSVVLGIVGRFSEALSSIDRILKVDPNNSDALYLRGLMLAATNQTDFTLTFELTFTDEAQELIRDTLSARLMKFIVSLEEQDLNQAKQDWLKFVAYDSNDSEQTASYEVAARVLRRTAEAGHWDFVRELIGNSSPSDSFFPLARALDYLNTGDNELIERLSPEVRKIVEEIVDTLERSVPKSNQNKRKAGRVKRKRA